MTDDILIIGIENWTTGQRPAGIDNDDIREGNLVCEAGQLHQRLDTEPYGDFEIRAVKDDRDITQYDAWTLHFADGSTLSDADGRAAIVEAIEGGRRPVDLDGVIPVPASQIDIANEVIRTGLPTVYRGDREQVGSWGTENGISLPAGTREMLATAYEEGCPYVTKVEPPEV